ncbi:GBA [Bugula neritina]|uniref:Glucosylceramidase n=1 Tax=Bugula neritina TaxID=10212 RepID=A0A7J7K023_BUGNE|nr:GBA [Bugula neritina]
MALIFGNIFQSIFCLLICLYFCSTVLSNKCDKVSFGDTSFVCRCNSSHCDSLPPLNSVPKGAYIIYSSSKDGDRFNTQTLHFSGKQPQANGKIIINRTAEYQSIIGFGGAVTDAASINILNLSPKTQDILLQSYYSPQGLEYTLARIPIASTDFSTHAYSYDDTPDDFDLSHFSLTSEDLKYKIPILKRAIAMSKRNIRLFSSPWSAPSWMKTESSMTGRGFLKGEPGGKYYKTWAQYLVRFLSEYKKQGLNIWGLTAQNEPLDGRLPFFPFQCLGFTATQQRDFIAMDLGPALHSGGFGDVKLMILDDDTLSLPDWANTIYSDESASQYVSGLGVHWYLNGYLSYNRITETHLVDPTKFILATEACAGSAFYEKKVMLGNWDRAEQYASDIMQDLQNWVTGWTDWNIALNMSGGPNWVNNNVDSPIIVDKDNDVFYKQPMFYTMGHFSKFLTPGSVRHQMDMKGAKSTGVVFSTPEKNLVMILFNKEDSGEILDVVEGNTTFTVSVKARSINTIIWKP